jgi:hypothetical protein
VLILAGWTAGSELEQIRIFGFANPRTAGMARGHGVMVSGLLLSHFTPGCTCQACMTNIGAIAISAQATMATSSAAAMDLFTITFSVADQDQP